MAGAAPLWNLEGVVRFGIQSGIPGASRDGAPGFETLWDGTRKATQALLSWERQAQGQTHRITGAKCSEPGSALSSRVRAGS